MPSRDGARISPAASHRRALPKLCCDGRLRGSAAVGQSMKPEIVASEHNKIGAESAVRVRSGIEGWQRQNATAKIERIAADARLRGKRRMEGKRGERRCR